MGYIGLPDLTFGQQREPEPSPIVCSLNRKSTPTVRTLISHHLSLSCTIHFVLIIVSQGPSCRNPRLGKATPRPPLWPRSNVGSNLLVFSVFVSASQGAYTSYHPARTKGLAPTSRNAHRLWTVLHYFQLDIKAVMWVSLISFTNTGWSLSQSNLFSAKLINCLYGIAQSSISMQLGGVLCSFSCTNMGLKIFFLKIDPIVKTV